MPTIESKKEIPCPGADQKVTEREQDPLVETVSVETGLTESDKKFLVNDIFVGAGSKK